LKRDLTEGDEILDIVAPLAGAWIETSEISFDNVIAVKSHPSRVRGLKL